MLVVALGRQPKLSLVELEARLGADAVKPLTGEVALLTIDELDHSKFGGIIKVGKVLKILENADFKASMKYIEQELPRHLEYFAGSKVPLGLSTYGFGLQGKELARAAFGLKKALRGGPKSLRIIESQGPELNTAQVLHNRLLDKGMELLLARSGKDTILAQTISLQDIEAYGKRDQARPKRDARVGMLPPKLAQIIVNLSTNQEFGDRSLEIENSKNLPPNPRPLTPESQLLAPRILDPFCGTGVILQEALLMGNNVCGTDLEPRMVEYSQINLDWLAKQYDLSCNSEISVADATTHRWQSIDAIATETYLGRPFSHDPKPDILRQVIQDVDTIHKKFLQNVARQTKPGFRMCIAVPAWKNNTSFKHLPILDHLEELGYTRASFVHADNQGLIYHREGQVVGRELVVLIRK